MTRWPRLVQRKWVIIVLALQLLGCEARTTPQGGARRNGESPAARFDWIMERFKRHCSGSSILVPTRTGASLVLRFVVDDVTYKVEGCERPDTACAATMTIKTSTHYSLLTGSSISSDGAADGTDPRAPAAESPQGPADAPSEKVSPLHRLTAEELLGRKSEEKTATYEFAFEQGRWVLKTDEVDASIRASLVFALRRQ